MTSSGTYNFSLSNADVVIEAFNRCQIRPNMLTGEHMTEARNSLNLGLSTFSNRGVNLWAVDLLTIPLIQGISQYSLPTETVLLLDVYLETYQLSNTANITTSLSTTSGFSTVTVNQTAHGLLPGQWINIATPVTIGGIVVSGYYQVLSVLNANSFTLTATNATSTVTSGGALRSFATTSGSSTVTVTFNNHGYSVNQGITVVSTTVGGLTLSGSYTVASVSSANTFTIVATRNASSTTSGYENGNLLNIIAQSATVDPIDRIMLPISRTDWAVIPDKQIQGPPTIYWFDKLISPVINVWQPPDANGPYSLKLYRMRRLQDAALGMGQTLDLPFRFTDAICADLAARLSMKYAPTLFQVLKAEAKEAWHEAWMADRERADISIMPNLSSYYSGL